MSIGNTDRLIVVALAVMSFGWHANSSLATPAAGVLEQRDPLTGEWGVSFHVEEPRADSAIADIEGTIALIEANPTQTSAYARYEQLDHVGVYNVPLEAVGVEPLPRRDAPIVFARMVSADSFTLTLNPGVSHGAGVLQGSVRGDEAAGAWQVTAYAAGARGTFKMHRIR
jgi:hypothetical protein